MPVPWVIFRSASIPTRPDDLDEPFVFGPGEIAMKNDFYTVALVSLVSLSSWAVRSEDLSADAVIADGVNVLEIGPDSAVSGTVSVVAGLSVARDLSVTGRVSFADGVPYLAPLGDVPMGSFTNEFGDAAASADAPSWWLTRHVIGTDAPNDYAMAVQGQVKWIACQAAMEFQSRLSATGGMGVAVSNLCASFSLTNNNLPVTLGQLKNVAKPFCDRLMDVGIVTNFPWAGEPSDFALANVGQVKFLFSFDLDRDTDGDGMPDWWEIRYGLNCNDSGDAAGDVDGDQVSNLLECRRATDPRDVASVNRTLYVDSVIGNDANDGCWKDVMSNNRGPKASVQQMINDAVSGDVIEMRGTAAFMDRNLTTVGKGITLLPIDAVRF